ncbi:hypothetical protein EDB85DRAFT_1894024 [Lactarius pseudohatsudake]|nr:hypothetical protein EDB85DRAFT_1894024 [Lactarius pseudohatsudake]
MSNTSLDMLASYTTPVQTQQPQTERPSEGTEITPGQKRKRADGPPQTPKENSPSIPPRYNREQSAPPPPSPTSEALKRRKLQNQAQANPNEQQPTGEQEMAVDDESTRPTEQANTPTPATGRRWYDEPQDNQQRPQQRNSGPSPNQNEDEASAEVDEQENAKTLARLLVTSERNMDKNFPNTHSNPLDRYTESQMPEIHERDPMTLLADLDSVQIQSWLDLPTGKVLARPFDQDVNYQPNHINIAKTLLTAAKEITGATTAAVAPPNRDNSVTVQHLDIRSGGGREDPHFNVYANGELIEDDETWLELRDHLRSRPYKSPLYGHGKAKREEFTCSLCHGRDHPRGLCKFPQIPGWNGGGRTPKRNTYVNPRGLDHAQAGHRNSFPQTQRNFFPRNA